MDILQFFSNVYNEVVGWLRWGNWGVWATIAVLVHLAFHIRNAWKERRRLRRERRASELRRAQFVLPDRDNAFVQARLHTALQPAVGGEEACEKREDFRFSYARKLLLRLKNAPLSVAERLQADDMEKTLGLYLQKDNLSAAEIRLMSDIFSAVLKLAAKYAV